MNTSKLIAQCSHLPKLANAPEAALFGRAWRTLRRWNELARQRRQLASLSDGMLKDIGRSRADIEQEANRPFWDDPEPR